MPTAEPAPGGAVAPVEAPPPPKIDAAERELDHASKIRIGC